MQPSTSRAPAATTAEELESIRVQAYLRDFIDSPRGSIEEIKKVYLDLKTARVTCERFLKPGDGQSYVSKGKTRLTDIFMKDPTSSFWSNVNGVNCSYEGSTKDCIIRASSGNLYVEMSDQWYRSKFYVCEKPTRAPASLVPDQEDPAYKVYDWFDTRY